MMMKTGSKNVLFKSFLLNIALTGLVSYFSKSVCQTPVEMLDTLYNWTLPSVCLYGNSEWVIGSVCSDIAEAGGDSPDDNPHIQSLAILDIKATNAKIREYYSWNFQNIYWCNAIKYKLLQSSDHDAESLRLYAEAQFFRSLSYFNLVRLFGGITVYSESDIVLPDSLEEGPEITEDNVADIWKCIDHFLSLKARNTKEEVWELIENELDSAINILPLKSELSAGEKHRITKGGAMTLMVKCKLYQEKWQEALDYAEQIITSNEYQLDSNYMNIFSLEGEHGPESIFELEQYYVGGPDLLDQKTFIWAYHNACNNPRFFDISPDMPDDLGLQNDGNFISYWGWGFNCPASNYANSFEPGDPRKKYTILEKGDSLLWATSGSDTVYWALFDPSNTLYTEYFHGEPSPTGYFLRKYFVSYNDYKKSIPMSQFKDFMTLQHEGGLKNIKVFRYADVLLMAAEAALHTGDTLKALQYINQVRTRARNSGKTGIPLNLSSLTSEDIFNERKWELGLEGHRYFDLIRTGMAYEILDSLYDRQHDAYLRFDTNKHCLFPIPIQEIIDSKGLIEQNPGYISWDNIGSIKQIRPIGQIDWEIDTNGSRYVTKTVLLNEFVDFSEYNLELNPIVTATFLSDMVTYSSTYSSNTRECKLFFKSDLKKIPGSYTDTVIINISNHKEEIKDTFMLRITLTGTASNVDLRKNGDKVVIYPNPLRDYIIIQMPGNTVFPVNLFIFSAQGNLLITRQINKNDNIIDVNKLSGGIYLLSLPELKKVVKLIIMR
jgi:hypothetical protein